MIIIQKKKTALNQGLKTSQIKIGKQPIIILRFVHMNLYILVVQMS